MKILTRYILRETSLFFCISLFAFTGILLVLRMLKLASLVINKGVDLSQVGMVFVAIVPTFLEIALPLAALLGVMLALSRLSGDSEITVIRASGVSLKQLIKPVALFGVVCCLITMVVSLHFKPWGYRQLSKSLFEIARRKSTAGLSAGVFNDLGRLTLYAEKIEHQTGDLSGVLIHDRRSPDERKVITANTGKILSSPQQKTITFHLKDGEIHELNNQKYVFTRYETNDIVTNPDELYSDDKRSSQEQRPRELSNAEINEELLARQQFDPYAAVREQRSTALKHLAEIPPLDPEEELVAQAIKKNESRIRRLRIEQARRFSIPFSALLLALFAMPLGIQPARTQKTWGAGLSASLGMIVFVVYFALLSVGVALGEAGTFPPILAVWFPNIITAVAAIYTLRRMGTEQWQSAGHAVEQIIEWIGKKIEGNDRKVPA